MIKKITLLLASAVSFLMNAQVGINTETPKSTLDIVAKKTDGSTPEGLMAPRLTGDQIALADGQYGADQEGALVYATTPVGTATPKTGNITSPGYYYFDGSIWQAFSGGDTAASGTPFVLSGTTTDAGNNNTDAIGRTGIVGIGTITPDAGSILDVTSPDKGLLVPRVPNVTSVLDPVNGMMVYDISQKCFKFYEKTAWTDCLSAAAEQTVKADCNSGGFIGCYYAGTVLSGAQFKVVLVNNTFQTVNLSGITTANLVLSGVSGVTVTAVSSATASMSAGGGTATLTFTLGGTPASSGILTGTFTKGVLTCSNNIGVNASPSVAINPSPANIPIGCTYPFTTPNSGVTWSSTSTSVATVDPTTGIVTAKAAGTTTIRATICGGLIASRTLTVVAKTYSYNSSTSGTLAVPSGIAQFTAEVYGSGGGGSGNRYVGSINGAPTYTGGYGGGGGSYTSKAYTVTSGSITYTVGYRGSYGNSGQNGTAGNASSVTYDSVQIIANGGKGGCYNSSSCGAGGIATGGDTNINGFTTTTYCGGKAGGPIGGDWQCTYISEGGSTFGAGTQGRSVGGGGSAATGSISCLDGSFCGGRHGGNGIDGRVIITFQCP